MASPADTEEGGRKGGREEGREGEGEGGREGEGEGGREGGGGREGEGEGGREKGLTERGEREREGREGREQNDGCSPTLTMGGGLRYDRNTKGYVTISLIDILHIPQLVMQTH